MKTIRVISLLAAATIALAGCDIFNPVDIKHQPDTNVVLTGFLTPGARVEATLRSTIPLTEYYPFRPLDPYALNDAIVAVTVNGTEYPLTQVASRPGVYTDSSLIVATGTTYDIEVTFPSGHAYAAWTLNAQTTVPNQVAMTTELSQEQIDKGARLDSLVFPKELANQSFFGSAETLTPMSISWDAVPGAAGYVVGIVAEDTTGPSLLRQWEYDDWLDGDYEDPDARQELQKSGFVMLPDSINADMFWILFTYQGWQDVVVFASDQAYHDYFRTVTQGAGQSGADADTGPALNVEGGLGVFGSYTADTVRTFVYPEWLPSEHVN